MHGGSCVAWECFLAAAACFGITFAAYLLTRRHARLDGTSAKSVFQEARLAWQADLPWCTVMLLVAWSAKLLMPGLVGAIGTMSAAFITAICGGITFAQVERLSCLWGEVFSGKPLTSCAQPK